MSLWQKKAFRNGLNTEILFYILKLCNAFDYMRLFKKSGLFTGRVEREG